MEGTFHSFLTQEKYNQDMREDDRFDVSSFEITVYNLSWSVSGHLIFGVNDEENFVYC